MDYIFQLKIENYGCVRHADLSLTPLHALIGPNDAGKSTILRALRTALTCGSERFQFSNGRWYPFNPGFGFAPEPSLASIRANGAGLGYGIKAALVKGDAGGGALVFEEHIVRGQEGQSSLDRITNRVGQWSADSSGRVASLMITPSAVLPNLEGPSRALISLGARLVHASPAMLRRPDSLAEDLNFRELTHNSSPGLASIYQAVLRRGDDSGVEIRRNIRDLFPTVKAVGLDIVGQGQQALRLELIDGTKVPAEHISEGLLYYLLFLCLQYLDPVAVLLVEEPENGLHPARIKEVMKILREISKTTQVLIATHSPLVINEMQPEEVSIVTRPPDKGTQVMRIDQTRNFAERSEVFALGELWLAYCDGEQESSLVNPQHPDDADEVDEEIEDPAATERGRP